MYYATRSPHTLGTNSVLNIISEVLSLLFKSKIGLRIASPYSKYLSLGVGSIPKNSAPSTKPLITKSLFSQGVDYFLIF